MRKGEVESLGRWEDRKLTITETNLINPVNLINQSTQLT